MEFGDGNGGEKVPANGRDPVTGQFVKGWKGGPGRGGVKPSEGVLLTERMGRILTEEWSDAELKRLLRDDPGTFKRLMELAGKAQQSAAGPVGESPTSAVADLDDGSRSAAEVLEKWLAGRGTGPRP